MLKDRLAAIVEILKRSNAELDDDPKADGTGFLSFKPEALAEAVLLLSTIKPKGTVLDLGCGNGGFALLAAAAGYDAYGIEIHPYLVEKALKNYEECVKRNLIGTTVFCKFIVGNFYPSSYKEKLEQFRKDHRENAQSMPWQDTEDPYKVLGIKLSEIDIIYTWSWPTQSRFLYSFLQDETKQDAIFILPAYVRYTQGEHMNAAMKEKNRLILHPVATKGDIFIGRKQEECPSSEEAKK